MDQVSDFDREKRLQFARINDDTSSLLDEIWKIVEPSLPQVLDEFYWHLTSEPELKQMLGPHIERLKVAQAKHWKGLFQGNFDQGYLSSVYTIGMVHSRIGLQPRWFIAAYQFILNFMVHLLIKRDHNPGHLGHRIAALNSAVLLDIDLVITAYLDASEREQERQVTVVTNKVVAELQTGIRAVADQAVDQSASVTETSATTTEILRNLEGLNSLIEEQAANLTQTSASVEQMVANIRSVTKNVQLMAETFGKLQAASIDGKDKITAVVTAVARVQAESKNLEDANQAIKGIAAQTNLLAMNAAIEAAHAGEAGRGFSVIASEIKKLSELSATQSKEISANIGKIAALIQSTSQSTAVADGSFRHVLDEVGSLSRFNDQIGLAMEEQDQGSQQILVATGEINKIMVRVKDRSAEMVNGSRMINQEMEKLLGISEGVRGNARELLAETEVITESVLQAHQR